MAHHAQAFQPAKMANVCPSNVRRTATALVQRSALKILVFSAAQMPTVVKAVPVFRTSVELPVKTMRAVTNSRPALKVFVRT